MLSRTRALIPAIVTAAFAGGCGGSGEGLDSNGRPIGTTAPTTAALTPDFQSIQDHVFTPICSVCHSGAGAPQGLRLDAANSYSLLVGVPSTEVPSVQRVSAGNPDGSYLIQKIEGRAAVGARMPLGGPYLDASTIAVIRQWIADGAKRPAAAATTQSLTPVVAVPAAGDRVPEAPARLVVEFNADLDPAMVGRAVLRLDGAQAAQGAATPSSVVATEASVPPANPRALVITPRSLLAPGHYRLVLGADVAVPAQRADAAAITGAPLTLTEFDVEARP